jgi:hypothetical protein
VIAFDPNAMGLFERVQVQSHGSAQFINRVAKFFIVARGVRPAFDHVASIIASRATSRISRGKKVSICGRFFILAPRAAILCVIFVNDRRLKRRMRIRFISSASKLNALDASPSPQSVPGHLDFTTNGNCAKRRNHLKFNYLRQTENGRFGGSSHHGRPPRPENCNC